MFDRQKKITLNKKDRSKKGHIDKEIESLLNIINSLKDYYTTSSCAGRIVLLRQPFSGRKKDAEWLYVTHSMARQADVIKCLDKPPKESVWLRQEPFIIHICARTVENADDLMDILRTAGLKHSGILSTRKRIIIEAIGLEHMDTPVSVNNELLVDDTYLRFLITEANKKLKKNKERIRLFYSKIKSME